MKLLLCSAATGMLAFLVWSVSLPVGCNLLRADDRRASAGGEWFLTLTTWDGEEVTGHCLRLTDELVELETAEGNLVVRSRREFLLLRTVIAAEAPLSTVPAIPALLLGERRPVTTGDSPGLVLFPNDDRLVLSSAVLSENELLVSLPGMPRNVSVPWETMALWWRGSGAVPEALLVGEPTRTDRVLLSNGDLLSGELEELGPRELSMSTTAGALQIDVQRLHAIAFNPDLISDPEEPREFAVVLLRNGSRITVKTCRLEESQLRLETLFGAVMNVPLDQILEVSSYGSRAISLNGWRVTGWEHEPFLVTDLEAALSADSGSSTLPERRLIGPLTRSHPAWNRSPLGGPLIFHGREFPRGIGMRPRARLSVSLPEGARWFCATVDLDDRTEGQGRVEFRLESDAEMLWSSQRVTGQEPPRTVGPIDVSGRSELTLVVDFAGRGDIRAEAGWGHPVILLSGE